MSIGSILFGFSLLILVALFISRPFMMMPKRQRRRRQGRHSLLADKNRLLEQIRFLDFEHETGKLPTDVYEVQRENLVKETAVILQKLDRAPTGNGKGAGLDAEIEAAIAHIRGQQPDGQQPAAAAVAARPRTDGGFCPQCGNPLDKEDKFCSTCGHKLV